MRIESIYNQNFLQIIYTLYSVFIINFTFQVEHLKIEMISYNLYIPILYIFEKLYIILSVFISNFIYCNIMNALSVNMTDYK